MEFNKFIIKVLTKINETVPIPTQFWLIGCSKVK